MEGRLNVGQFGEELRRERESRGITLETISDATKVIKRYLAALEDSNFSALPGGILAKGIVRGYARTIGLDETVWIERFVVAANQQKSLQEDNWVEFAQNVGKSRAREPGYNVRMRWAGVAVLLLLLAGFGWFVWSYVSGRVMAGEMPRPAVTATAAATPAASDSQ